MSKCYECKKKINLDCEAFYPYMSNDSEDLNPHELADTPFCEKCANKEIITNK